MSGSVCVFPWFGRKLSRSTVPGRSPLSEDTQSCPQRHSRSLFGLVDLRSCKGVGKSLLSSFKDGTFGKNEFCGPTLLTYKQPLTVNSKKYLKR